MTVAALIAQSKTATTPAEGKALRAQALKLHSAGRRLTDAEKAQKAEVDARLAAKRAEEGW